MEKQLPTKSELLLAIQWASIFISDCHLGVYNLVCLNRLYDFLDRIAEPSFGYKQLIKDYLHFVNASCNAKEYVDAARYMNLAIWELTALPTAN